MRSYGKCCEGKRVGSSKIQKGVRKYNLESKLSHLWEKAIKIETRLKLYSQEGKCHDDIEMQEGADHASTWLSCEIQQEVNRGSKNGGTRLNLYFSHFTLVSILGIGRNGTKIEVGSTKEVLTGVRERNDGGLGW